MIRHTRVTVETVSLLFLTSRSLLVPGADSGRSGPFVSCGHSPGTRYRAWEVWFCFEEPHRLTVGGSSLLCLTSLRAHLENIRQPATLQAANQKKESQ